MPSTILRLLAALLALGLVVAACGGDDGGDGGDRDEESSQDEGRDEDGGGEDGDDTTTTTAPEDERDEAIGDFGDTVADQVDPATTGPATYGEYTQITDDSGAIRVEVPVAWSDVDGRPGLFGPDVIASTDVAAWVQTYDVSGIEIQVTGLETNETTDQILDAVSRGQASQCRSLGRQPYQDPLYTGVSEVFEACAGTDTGFVWLAFEPADRSYHGIVGVQITTEADVEALERALATFVAEP
jgi:hypothetical protein